MKSADEAVANSLNLYHDVIDEPLCAGTPTTVMFCLTLVKGCLGLYKTVLKMWWTCTQGPRRTLTNAASPASLRTWTAQRMDISRFCFKEARLRESCTETSTTWMSATLICATTTSTFVTPFSNCEKTLMNIAEERHTMDALITDPEGETIPLWYRNNVKVDQATEPAAPENNTGRTLSPLHRQTWVKDLPHGLLLTDQH